MGRLLKRLLDVVSSSLALLVFSPFMVIVAGAIKVNMGSPVIFSQVRPGIHERPIKVFKFRTMRDANGPDGRPLPDAVRLTKLGIFLRKTSLDEFPQLWNVMRGNLSLVGPRPLLNRYLPYYTDRERLRFSVPPGITGWAQIHGRNTVSWTQRLEHDAWYVENWSIWLDIKILLMTALKVLRRQGVVVDANSIMMDLDEERRAAGPTPHATVR